MNSRTCNTYTEERFKKISQKSNNNTKLQTFLHTYEQILQREKNNMREFRLIATVADPDLYSSGGRLHTYIYSPILGQNWARIGRYIGIKKNSAGALTPSGR